MKSGRVELKSEADRKLIELSMGGNMHAFEEIVRRFEPVVARVVIPMVGQDAADDVGQEVFIRFYKSMSKFKGDAKLSTYLVRIAINLSLNEIKKSRRITRSDESEIEKHINSFNTEELTDLKQIIQYSLNQLQPEFRSIVVLRNIEGYSTKETASILGIPQGTVLSRLSRGHQKLKEIITKLDIL